MYKKSTSCWKIPRNDESYMEVDSKISGLFSRSLSHSRIGTDTASRRSTVLDRASVLVWPSSFENLCFVDFECFWAVWLILSLFVLFLGVFVVFELVFVVFAYVVFGIAFVTEILFPQKDERTRTDTLKPRMHFCTSLQRHVFENNHFLIVWHQQLVPRGKILE